MSGTIWPSVLARLVSQLPAVVGSSVLVLDGPTPTGQNPTAYLSIGQSPSTTGDTNAGRFQQDVGHDGYSAVETGEIVCELGAMTGNADVPDVFTTFNAIAAWLQADMTLGGTLTAGSTCTASAQVVQAQTGSGAVQRLLVSITYTTNVI